LCAVAPLAACALDAPAVEDVLGRPAPGSAPSPDGASLPLAERGARAQAELDSLVAKALAAARAGDDPAAATRAARVLFESADLRLQRAALAHVSGLERPSCREVLEAEDRVPDDVRQQVLGLCTAGEEHGKRALARQPDGVEAELYVALNLALIAWANGPVRALFAGHGPRITAAIDRAVALDATFDHAAPLRLQGRFLGKAPWPYGDAAKARKALERAVATADLTVNHVFLGDLLWGLGDHAAATAQWGLAIRAGDDDSTRWSGPFYRELARARIAAASRER